ncbi:CU044_2847 family protein [Streptomyces sp. NPDC058000]|uniref:CU044_2847 family protein n=1 Tax=Streptomyces sp. NPDC058000 TaxID=3346299 RepID=UPI0036E4FD7A
MAPLARLPLDGGGFILVQETSTLGEGPVKAGRIGGALHEMSGTLQGALEPIVEAARATLDELCKARPDEITVEFGVDLAVEAGAVITKGQAGCHLKVTLGWKKGSSGLDHPHTDESLG